MKNQKKAYVTPALTVYGSMHALTQKMAAGSATPDATPGKVKALAGS